MSFGERLRSSRNAKKLTQKEVANLVGIDDTTISKYENDNSEPDKITLNKLCDLYGVSTDYLYGREIKINNTKEETENQKKIRRLHELADQFTTEEQIDAAIIVMKSIIKK